MFIINITYKDHLENIDKHLTAHVKFLDEHYTKGVFFASGRKIPRTGGVILSNMNSKVELEQVLEKDPFKINELANYEIIEFVPTKTVEQLQFLVE